MISLVSSLPSLSEKSAESVKINCLFEAYKNDDRVLFWVQDEEKAVISLSDSNMILHNISADMEELKEFVEVINPVCIFSDLETLENLGKTPKEKIYVMARKADLEGETKGDTLSSKELYALLDTDGLSLPEYPYFAVDFCKRLNMGTADYFALKDTCAAITFSCQNSAIMNGIASHEKGYGSIALKAVLQKNKGREFLVCCREKIKGFYEKNGFTPLYFAGYWVKNN